MQEAVIRRVAKTESEAREAKRKSTTVVKASDTKKLFLMRRQQPNIQDPAHPRHLPPQPMRHRSRQHWCASTRMRTHCGQLEIYNPAVKGCSLVHRFFGICLADPPLAQARTSSV